MNKVAIIPARGGSKRVPGKNTRLFHGRPMLSYPIRAARESGLFDRIIVSTDSVEVARIAREEGAETPFVRPAQLSDDLATTASVLTHALEWLASEGQSPVSFACLYPCTPFLTSQRLQQGYELLVQRAASTVFAVTAYPHGIFRALKIGQNGMLEMIWPEHELTRGNDLPAAYHDAGQFYWLSHAAFRESKKVWGPGSVPLILPPHEAIDIDTPEDWSFAEKMYLANRPRESR